MKVLHGFHVDESVKYIEDWQLLALGKNDFMQKYVGYKGNHTPYQYDLYKRDRLEELLAEMLPDGKSLQELMDEDNGNAYDRFNYRKKALELVNKRLDTVARLKGKM